MLFFFLVVFIFVFGCLLVCAVSSSYVIDVFVYFTGSPIFCNHRVPSTFTEYEVLGIHPVGTVDLL